MRRSGTPPSAARVYGPNDLITLVDATRLLADRDRRKHDSDRTRTARMRHHIKYAVDNRQLTEMMRQGKKHYVYGRIAAWAENKWPGKYGDLLAIRDPNSGVMRATLSGGYRLKASGFQTPVTLVECQIQLQQAMLRITKLEQELIVAREVAERLRPDAEARRRVRATNKVNAQRRRPRGQQ